MEFNLIHIGQVKSKDTPTGKHKLRCIFHHQLRLLWELPPLNRHKAWHSKAPELLKTINRKKFLCLVSKKLDMYAELDFKFLVPRNSTFHDIDNKLKVICDALKMPKGEGKSPELPTSWKPEPNEKPLICLLEDDDLIYKLNADTEYILESKGQRPIFQSNNEMIVLINVKIKGNRFIRKYSDLIV